MLRVRGITHHRTSIQGLPSRSRKMDRHSITLILVASNKVGMRHRCRGGVNWTGIYLNADAVCSQEQRIPRRYGEDAGNRLVLINRLTGILIYTLDQAGFLLGGSIYLERCTGGGDPNCNRTGGRLNAFSTRYIHVLLPSPFRMAGQDVVDHLDVQCRIGWVEYAFSA